MKITELPFNQFIGITASEKDGTALTLPGEPRYTNHLGTVHASALLALAEASSGDYLLKEFAHLGFEVVPVVRRLEAKFRKPAFGAIFSKVNVAPAQREAFLSVLTQKGRALLEIMVDVFDEKDTHALAVTVEWFIAKK
jgi:hypothetical protein